MKNIFYCILTILLGTTVLSSCELHTSNNGDLDNWWWLQQVDSLENDESVNYHDQKIFWSFIADLMETSGPSVKVSAKSSSRTFIYRFNNTDGKLIVSQPYVSARDIGDIPITKDSVVAVQGLASHGINFDPETVTDTFYIETLNSDEMVLKDKKIRLHFISY